MNYVMPRGRIVWYECLTSDRDRAVAFYTALFGWTATAAPPGGMDYTMLHNGGAGLGGLMALPPDALKAGATPHWMMYVGTPDVDGTIAQALTLGAEVVAGPHDIPGMGRFAVLNDPQDAVFALFTAVQAPGDLSPPPALGSVAWNELATSDLDAAFAFYQALFGWEKRQAVDMGPHGTYQIWGRPEEPQDLGGMYHRTPEMRANAWCYYFRVAALDAALERAGALGATVIVQPMVVSDGSRIAVLLDPCGAVFAMVCAPTAG